ncbi:MAG TPA: ATP-binding cassette domain-containing protein [Dermatophilaceae bacterium]
MSPVPATDGRDGPGSRAQNLETLVDVEGVSKEFRVRGADGRSTQFRAVDNVSFTVERHGSLGIVGESGSGKTTLARILVGLEQPTSGTLAVGGATLDSRTPSRKARKLLGRSVQMVYQDPYSSLDPLQTIGAGLDEILRLRSDADPKRRKERAGELLEQVGMGASHLTSRPSQMSGGQLQRVAIARALACTPRLLVLDEAVSALDVSVQGQALNLLSDLRETLDVAYVFVSHDLAVVQQVSDHIIVMHHGQIVERGRTDHVLNQPKDEYTKTLLAAVPTAGWKPRTSSN